MQNRLLELENQRREVASKIILSAVKIQANTRGFITRLKLQKVQQLTSDFERAKLNEMLGSMQATVKGLADPELYAVDSAVASSSEKK